MGHETAPSVDPDVVSVGGVPVGRLAQFDIAAVPGNRRVRMEIANFDDAGLAALGEAWQ
jgi:hypothetical protein